MSGKSFKQQKQNKKAIRWKSELPPQYSDSSFHKQQYTKIVPVINERKKKKKKKKLINLMLDSSIRLQFYILISVIWYNPTLWWLSLE